MGLLDTRDPPTFSQRLLKADSLYRVVTKMLTLRKTKVASGPPQKGIRFFQYHLLSQQGVPGGVKVGLVAASMVLPILTASLLSGRKHQYRKDPFR